jgi:hypothetical protein
MAESEAHYPDRAERNALEALDEDIRELFALGLIEAAELDGDEIRFGITPAGRTELMP